MTECTREIPGTLFYFVMLLNQNLKLAKANKYGITQFGLELLPHTLGGINICKFSSLSCRTSCISGAGYGNMPATQVKRKYRTELFHKDNVEFIRLLIAEITYLSSKHKTIHIRLNCFSDIEWEKIKLEKKNIFEHLEHLSNVVLYDYTKNPKRYNLKIPNYHVVYSGQADTEHIWKKVLENGGQVALVFTKVPQIYKGWIVVNGDDSDNLWQWRNQSVIIGLKYKNVIIKGKTNKELLVGSKLLINEQS